MLELIYQLAERSDQSGDYITRSEVGHDVQHLRLANWRISFWADHAVRELRVVDLTKL